MRESKKSNSVIWVLFQKAIPQSSCSSVAVKLVYFCITEAVPRRCFVRKAFLKICKVFWKVHVAEALLTELQAYDAVLDYRHRCLPVNSAKFRRSHIFHSSSPSSIIIELIFCKNASFRPATVTKRKIF